MNAPPVFRYQARSDKSSNFCYNFLAGNRRKRMADYKLKILRKNIRHAYIRVNDDGEVIVTCSRRMSDAQIKKFLSDREDWIMKRVSEAKSRTEPESLDGEILSVFGMPREIQTVKSNVRSVSLEDGRLLVLAPEEDMDAQCEAVTEYLGKLFSEYAEEAVERCRLEAFEFFRPTDFRLKIKLLKSRYGSYSKRTNTMVLNMFMVRFPEDVIDSVIYHELAHIRHMNHQADFYRLVYAMCPDYDRLQKILKSERLNYTRTWFL